MKLRYWLRALLPDYWLMLLPFSRDWDRLLNSLLDKHEFSDIGPYTAKLGGLKIWIGNYPYSFANPHGWAIEVRPRRATIARTREALLNCAFR